MPDCNCFFWTHRTLPRKASSPETSIAPSLLTTTSKTREAMAKILYTRSARWGESCTSSRHDSLLPSANKHHDTLQHLFPLTFCFAVTALVDIQPHVLSSPPCKSTSLRWVKPIQNASLHIIDLLLYLEVKLELMQLLSNKQLSNKHLYLHN